MVGVVLIPHHLQVWYHPYGMVHHHQLTEDEMVEGSGRVLPSFVGSGRWKHALAHFFGA